MDNLTALGLVGLGALVLLSALLTGAEAAFFSLGRARLRRLAEQQGSEAASLAP
ncbi:MAG: HlyC/CorC family transporter, partial [Candidatus Rokubacteria bacterium]|nr:HlyC/CorC family transporter [Candidatus Rokubacteria bacterium]